MPGISGVRLPHDVIDVLLVAFILYRMLVMLKGTRAFQILVGLIVIVAAYVGSQALGLMTLHWILDAFLSSFILVVVILFQNDIRRALAHVGKRSFWSGAGDVLAHASLVEEIAKTCDGLSARGIGAIVVVERTTRLHEHIEGGVAVDAALSRELLQAIFQPGSPLHDGAAIVREGRVLLASAFLPLTTRVDLEQDFGTRHRAAIGITEETDAVAVVVSEETGAVSVVLNGRMTRNLDGPGLRRVLARLFPGKRAAPAPRKKPAPPPPAPGKEGGS